MGKLRLEVAQHHIASEWQTWFQTCVFILPVCFWIFSAVPYLLSLENTINSLWAIPSLINDHSKAHPCTGPRFLLVFILKRWNWGASTFKCCSYQTLGTSHSLSPYQLQIFNLESYIFCYYPVNGWRATKEERTFQPPVPHLALSDSDFCPSFLLFNPVIAPKPFNVTYICTWLSSHINFYI